MKNLFLHYLAVIAPFALLLFGNGRLWDAMPSTPFIVLFFAWCLLYIPFLTGRRLYIKGIISKPRLVYNLTWKQFKDVCLSK